MSMKPPRKRLLRVIALLLVLAALLLWFRHQVALDSCQDRGGIWNHEQGACDR
jgi:hypothetical protein